jgi:hypothetical protein
MNLQQLQEQKAQLLQKQKEVSEEESAKITVMLLDIEDAIEEKMLEGEPEDAPKGYVPAKGTEKMVHLKIVNGRRYSSATGKEISKPYKQMFTLSEWNVVKKHHRQIGFEIVEVLHDPTGEAQQYVSKAE